VNVTVTRRRLRCDVCQSATVAMGDEATWAELRRWARTCGWTRCGGQDRCTRCTPPPEPKTIPHGTWNGYNWHRCRCAECRAANHAKNEARRERRRSVQIPDDVKHGSYVTYVEYGCRCVPCCDANREYFRQWRSGRDRTKAALERA
jgi:hypothetical protein